MLAVVGGADRPGPAVISYSKWGWARCGLRLHLDLAWPRPWASARFWSQEIRGAVLGLRAQRKIRAMGSHVAPV